jgi:hypothetical protein
MINTLARAIFKLFRTTPLIVWVIIIIAAFLRLYRIDDFATFLGDQGRDTIIMYEIATLKHFPALGPVTSIGRMFLGPLYYYLMSPWLLIAGFNPVGPAIGVAVLATFAIWLQFHAVEDMLKDRMSAILSVAFTATSWVLIEYNRFSWNPNLLAPLGFFTIWAWYKALQTKQLRYYILAGTLFSASMQMHYLGITLAIVFAITYLFDMAIHKAQPIQHLWRMLCMVGAWAAVLAPFLLFEAIHNFPNTRSVLLLNSNENTQTANRLGEVFSTFTHVVTYTMQQPLQENVSIILFTCISIVALVATIKKQPIGYLCTAFVLMILVTSLYTGAKFPHYLGTFYILFYTIVSYIVMMVSRNKWARLALITVVMGAFMFLQAPNYRFLYENPSRQIARAKNVADVIAKNTDSSSYRITALPEQYASYSYRYMLIAYYQSPIDSENKHERGDELFVVCEQECDPRSSPLWDIAFFSPEKTAGIYHADGATVYKLTR